MKRVLEPEVMDSPEEANAYDAMDHSTVNHAFARRLLELGATGRVLDIGCGPGHGPLQLVAMASKVSVVGVDLSQHMLTIAEEHRAVSSHGERVGFALADAKKLDYADGSFDAVCSNTILHHIPNPVEFLREAWRVCAEGGALLIRDLYRPETMAEVDALVEKHTAHEVQTARDLFHASLCAALTPDELVDIAREAGMQGCEVVIDSDRHMSLQVAATKAE
jgi:ubiquinone/menaquinone biosynthesis C-methylase UbiE